MKAMVRRRYGSPAVLSIGEVPEPQLRDDSVLIRVRAASVNRADWETLRGRPLYVRLSGVGLWRPKGPILGSDVAGTVEAVGPEVTKFAVGDEVIADGLYHGGPTFAERVVMPEGGPVVLKPPGMSFETAAAIPQAGLLAMLGLQAGGGVQPGQHVLVNGAGGGGGSFAIQLAKHLGAEVTGVDSAAKGDFMRSFGADHVMDYRSESYTKRKGSYDRILDFTGHRSIFRKRRALAPGGSYLVAGGSMPRLLEAATLGWVLSKTGSRSSQVLVAQPSAQRLAELVSLVEEGAMTPAIDHVYGLEALPEALARLGAGDAHGKLVVTP